MIFLIVDYLALSLQMLSDIRTKICNELNMKISAVELSMGMSADYEEAVQLLNISY